MAVTGWPLQDVAVAVVVMGLVILRHRSNIARMWRGTEIGSVMLVRGGVPSWKCDVGLRADPVVPLPVAPTPVPLLSGSALHNDR